MSALMPPADAALERLRRAAPLLGWHPITENARVAPTWHQPNHELLLTEVVRDLIPRIARLYRPGLVPPQQDALLDAPTVASPESGGRTSSLVAHATLPPLSLLTLPATGDPFFSIATGFGTGYAVDQAVELRSYSRVRSDFLITASYEALPNGLRGAEMAAFVPAPEPHGAMPSPNTLTAERAGLVAPDRVDQPWRETIRVSWDRQSGGAALGRATGASLARYELGGGSQAESLLEWRDAGDRRPLLVVPDGPEGTTNYSRSALVDAAAVIPLASGGRQVGYGVAVQDVFGIWSRWEDVAYAGNEPALPAPRIIALALTSTYTGTSSCPATMEVELGVDWADRTPVRVSLAAVFYRLAAANSPPPGPLTPTGAWPATGFRRDVALQFVGNTLTGPAGVTIDHLDPAGEGIVTPGTLQGMQGRRYRVRVPIPTLDFSPTPRWGVRVWASTTQFAALSGASAWSPPDTNPATASAASPVPVLPLAPPPLPGVPVGSAPDAQGCSHARVRWSLPSGTDVRTVVVWEVAETALRQAAGMPQKAAEGVVPGARLLALRTAYDALPAPRRRAAFRRLLELPGDVRETDIALPRGTKDIHLFTVTAVTSTGVESPWPDSANTHEFLQAVAAPRLRRPAAPQLRAVLSGGDMVALSLRAMSHIPVREFRLYRTKSADAARHADTMGPAFAVVPAAAVVPVVGDPATQPDAITREQPYAASWSGAFATSWDDWFVRAVAIPVDDVPEKAERGIPSSSSDVVSITVLPDSEPDLAPLTSAVWGAARDGVVVFTSTAAPFRLVALGSHRIGGEAGVIANAPVEVHTVMEGPVTVAGPAPSTASDTVATLVHGPRASGRTPLARRFKRVVPGLPVDVVLRLADPLGRLTEQRITVPGWTPPPPSLPSLQIVDVFSITGRGVLVTVRSDASLTAVPPWMLRITATPRRQPAWPRVPGFPGRPPMRPRPVTATFELRRIPNRREPFGRTDTIQAMRATLRSPHEYQVLIRLAQPLVISVVLENATGARVEVTR